jgi:hypothetical protein
MMACVSSITQNAMNNFWDDDERNVRTSNNPWRRDAIRGVKDWQEPLEPLLHVCKAILKEVMDPRKTVFAHHENDGNSDEDDCDDDYDDENRSSSSSSSPSGIMDRNYCAKSSSLSNPSYECVSDDYDIPLENNEGEGDKDDSNAPVDCTVHVTPFFYT